MHSIKHSNWILGLGVVVAIILIVATIWIRVNPEQSNDAVNNTSPEIENPILQVDLGGLRWVSSLIKTLN